MQNLGVKIIKMAIIIDKQKLVSLIKEKLSEEIFGKSQEIVPVKTASLKQSGKIEFIDDVINVSYGGVSTGINNPVKYAIDVEIGFNTPRTVRVPAYTRKDGTSVKSFNMTFKPRLGRFYCKNSIENILNERLDDIIIDCLKQMPEVINVEKTS